MCIEELQTIEVELDGAQGYAHYRIKEAGLARAREGGVHNRIRK
jgi:hypothetical protein